MRATEYYILKRLSAELQLDFDYTGRSYEDVLYGLKSIAIIFRKVSLEEIKTLIDTIVASTEYKAVEFAEKAHDTQVRKYSGEPYVFHTIDVADIIRKYATEEMLLAAILHDVVEDTPVTLQEVEEAFGGAVATLVEMLTDVAVATDGNRETRMAINREHTAKASPEAKTIKLGDLISNTRSIVEHDKKFARVYLKEKAKLLEVLKEGTPADLYQSAYQHLVDGELAVMREHLK